MNLPLLQEGTGGTDT